MTRAACLLMSLLCLAFTNETPAPDVGDFDRVIQERFGNVTDEDIHKGRLGASRIAVPAVRRTFVPATERERAPLARLRKEGWSASMFVLTADGRLAAGPIRTARQEAFPEAVDRKEVLRLGKRAIGERAALSGVQGAFRMEARPVPVSGPSCAGCHDPSLKAGDPLGAVVYVLQRRPPQ